MNRFLLSLLLLLAACKRPDPGPENSPPARIPLAKPLGNVVLKKTAPPPALGTSLRTSPDATLPTPPDLKDPKDVQKTASGLRYRVLQPGKGGPFPKPADKVSVHYSGWLEDGTMFDSSVKRGLPSTFPLNGVIKGWTEGVGLMTVGQKNRFWIPFELAYGETGCPPIIPPKATLIFDVELLEIKNDAPVVTPAP